KAGASSSPPSLRRAMPLAVPLVSSSNLDCSQVRVPSARAIAENAKMERVSADTRANVLRAKVIPHFDGGVVRIFLRLRYIATFATPRSSTPAIRIAVRGYPLKKYQTKVATMHAFISRALV